MNAQSEKEQALMQAILSMDAYNRKKDGDDVTKIGMKNVPNKLGGYEVVKDERKLEDESRTKEIAAGYYAQVYRKGNEIVIAYRGTDNYYLDVVNGWGVGAGSGQGPQAKMAFDTYNRVSQNGSITNVTVTGHSLGGGLAGLVSSFKDVQATIFDSMPYNNAANAIVADVQNYKRIMERFNDRKPLTTIDYLFKANYEKTVAYKANGASETVPTLFSKQAGYRVEGEILGG